MPPDRPITTSRQQPPSSLVPLPGAESSALQTATGPPPRTAGEPGPSQAQVLVAVWCCSVGTRWTLELHQPTLDTTLGPLVDWISSEVPTSHPEPEQALARALLAEHGLNLYPDTDAGPRTHTRRSIGYVSVLNSSFAASVAAPCPESGALHAAQEGAGDDMAAPAPIVPSPRCAPPKPEPWTAERLHALLLRVMRAADVGLLLPQDADWIRAQVQAVSPPAHHHAPLIEECHSTR